MTRILVLNTKTYADHSSVKAALETTGDGVELKWINLDPSQTGEAYWDLLVEELLAADKIISI